MSAIAIVAGDVIVLVSREMLQLDFILSIKTHDLLIIHRNIRLACYLGVTMAFVVAIDIVRRTQFDLTQLPHNTNLRFQKYKLDYAKTTRGKLRSYF